jgi:hypothetical protein
MKAAKAVYEMLVYWADESSDLKRLRFVLGELIRRYE